MLDPLKITMIRHFITYAEYSKFLVSQALNHVLYLCQSLKLINLKSSPLLLSASLLERNEAPLFEISGIVILGGVDRLY